MSINAGPNKLKFLPKWLNQKHVADVRSGRSPNLWILFFVSYGIPPSSVRFPPRSPLLREKSRLAEAARARLFAIDRPQLLHRSSLGLPLRLRDRPAEAGPEQHPQPNPPAYLYAIICEIRIRIQDASGTVSYFLIRLYVQ